MVYNKVLITATHFNITALSQRRAAVDHILVPEAPEDDTFDRWVWEEEAQHRVVVVCPLCPVLLPDVQLCCPDG